MRMELEFMLIGRTNSSHYNKPYVYTTNQRVDDYFELRGGMSLEKFAKGLECFLLSGIDGALLRIRIAAPIDVRMQVLSIMPTTSSTGSRRGRQTLF